MNLLLVEAAEVGGDRRVTLRGRRARHAIDVLRVEVGAALRVGVVRGATGQGRVTAIDDDRLELELEMSGPPAEVPPVDLLCAVPRPKVVGRLLQTAASLGVGRIDLVNAWRVEKSFFSTARLAPERTREDLWLGCEQGGTTWLPDVAVERLLLPYLASLPAPGPNAIRVLAHPRAEARLEDVVAPGTTARVTLAIGPEGGWIDSELSSLGTAGFVAARLGQAILRSEIAVAAALSQLELLRRLPAG